jgi:acetoin utilization protein AcuB
MLVRSRMTQEVHAVAPQHTIADALALTRTHRIRHLPVVENEKVVGIVTERDLRLAAPPVWAVNGEEVRAALSSKKVGDVMGTHVITATPGTPIEEAAKLLYENRIGCVPVLENDRLVGILTESDLLRALVELFGAHHPFARLEIRMPNRAGELARVVRVIGIEHKVNISGLIVPPSEGDTYSTAIFQLVSTDPLPIIAALRKLGYKVGWPTIDLDPDADSDGFEEDHPGSQPRRRIPLEI